MILYINSRSFYITRCTKHYLPTLFFNIVCRHTGVIIDCTCSSASKPMSTYVDVWLKRS